MDSIDHSQHRTEARSTKARKLAPSESQQAAMRRNCCSLLKECSTWLRRRPVAFVRRGFIFRLDPLRLLGIAP